MDRCLETFIGIEHTPLDGKSATRRHIPLTVFLSIKPWSQNVTFKSYTTENQNKRYNMMMIRTALFCLAVFVSDAQCQAWGGQQPQGQWNSQIGSQGGFGGSNGGPSMFGGGSFGPSLFGGGSLGTSPFGSSDPFGSNNFRSNPGTNWINSGPFGMNGRNAPNGQPFGPNSFGPNGPMPSNPNAWGSSPNQRGPFSPISPFLSNSPNSQMNSFESTSNFRQNPFQRNLNSRSNNPFVPPSGSMVPFPSMPFMPNSAQNRFDTGFFQGFGWQPGMASLAIPGTPSIGSSRSASNSNGIDISEGRFDYNWIFPINLYLHIYDRLETFGYFVHWWIWGGVVVKVFVRQNEGLREFLTWVQCLKLIYGVTSV